MLRVTDDHRTVIGEHYAGVRMLRVSDDHRTVIAEHYAGKSKPIFASLLCHGSLAKAPSLKTKSISGRTKSTSGKNKIYSSDFCYLHKTAKSKNH